ncbi:MAG: TIGR02281 family clan AA aspartic protease [Rhodocyclaceae bacterium]|jgi:aspartyl protease family protein|nr:MAG: TIGR02281 family clan AA aspartic protease [Rhodocyclaceae bacterium]
MCKLLQLYGIRHCIVAAVFCLSALPAAATGVAVAGVFSGKALLVIDGGAPTIVHVGQTTAEGVRLVSVEGDAVVVELDGKRRSIRMGQHVVSQKGGDGPQETKLAADARGHFQTVGAINGRSTRFVIDTGATMVSMGTSEAARIGIDWRKGQPSVVQTANGVVRAWRVTLDSVRVGDVTINGVDGLVQESDLPIVLLGMSFLSRTEMRNEGTTMTLKKRF